MKTPMTLRTELILGGLTGVLVSLGLWWAGRSYGFADFRIIGFKIPNYVLAGLVVVAVVTLRFGIKRLKAGGYLEIVRVIQVVLVMFWASIFFGFVRGSAAVSLMWCVIAVALLVLPLSTWLDARSAHKAEHR
jgi:hypothetical protein